MAVHYDTIHVNRDTTKKSCLSAEAESSNSLVETPFGVKVSTAAETDSFQQKQTHGQNNGLHSFRNSAANRTMSGSKMACASASQSGCGPVLYKQNMFCYKEVLFSRMNSNNKRIRYHPVPASR